MITSRLAIAGIAAMLCMGSALAAEQPQADASTPAVGSAVLSPEGYSSRLQTYFEAKQSAGVVEKDANRLTRLNLQVVQQALERWAMDHSEVNENGLLSKYYPGSISQLVQAGYLSSGLYPNAYSAGSPDQLNALEVPLGWTAQAPGNFSYLTDLKSATQARSYVLVGYGAAPRAEWSNDLNPLLNGICCSLSSEGPRGSDIPKTSAMWQGGRSYNVGLMFGGSDNATAEFYFNKREGRLDSAAALDLAKTQLHALQLAVERFSVDYSPPDVEGLSWDQQERRYPEAISALVQETYTLAGFYANPFTAASPIELNAREMPFGWTEDAPGNFSYLKHYSPAGNVDGYCLLLYAASLDAGRDVTGDGVSDGVALWLSSNMDLTKPEVFYCGSQRITVVNQ